LQRDDDADSPREPFTIEKGQKIQVVGVDEQGVHQLARGAGYVVATVNQLVKVGGPIETSCKLEGMLESVLEKQQELRRKLVEISKLAIGLEEQILLEQTRPEEVPVISAYPKKSSSEEILVVDRQEMVVSDENDDYGINCTAVQGGSSHPTTPTNAFKITQSASPTVVASGGVDSVTSANSTAAELGAPSTPQQQPPGPGPYLEAEQPYSATDGYNMNYHVYSNQQFVHSPARSCPMPTSRTPLDQPGLDEHPTDAGTLQYRVHNEDDMYGLGWAGVLGGGSSLFGERLGDSSRRHESNRIFNTTSNDIIALSFDENSLMERSNTQRRAAAMAAVAVSTRTVRGGVDSNGSVESPLRRGGSFDGVNFRTGMSGHRGLGQPGRERQYAEMNGSNAAMSRRTIRMMSQHQGASTIRGGRGYFQRRKSTPDTLVDCQTMR